MRIFNHPLTSPPIVGAWVQLSAEDHRVIDEALACYQRELMSAAEPRPCIIGGDYTKTVQIRDTFQPMWERMKQIEADQAVPVASLEKGEICTRH